MAKTIVPASYQRCAECDSSTCPHQVSVQKAPVLTTAATAIRTTPTAAAAAAAAAAAETGAAAKRQR